MTVSGSEQSTNKRANEVDQRRVRISIVFYVIAGYSFIMSAISIVVLGTIPAGLFAAIGSFAGVLAKLIDLVL